MVCTKKPPHFIASAHTLITCSTPEASLWLSQQCYLHFAQRILHFSAIHLFMFIDNGVFVTPQEIISYQLIVMCFVAANATVVCDSLRSNVHCSVTFRCAYSVVITQEWCALHTCHVIVGNSIMPQEVLADSIDC